MPRSVKESSDDESDVKTAGRRTKTLAGGLSAATDSPLRRSTRNKPTISPPETAGDSDASSTVSAASSVQSARTTRRRTITTIPESTAITESLPTRSLRSRKTSTTSTTSLDNLAVDPVVVMTDLELIKDAAKPRVTRRSTSGSVSAETPPASRLRHHVRAGSESKTMSPSTVRITRRTRASSVDLDEQRDEVKPIHYNIKDSNQHSTPVKTRKRASVLPSEPPVVEETETVSQNCLSLSSTSIKEAVDDKNTEETENASQQPEQENQQGVEANKSVENDNDDNNNNNNNSDNEDGDVSDDNSSPATGNQAKASSPTLQLRMSIGEGKDLDHEMAGMNDEKLSTSVANEIKSPVQKINSSFIAHETSAVVSNASLLSPKVSAAVNSSISLKSPIADVKSNNFVEKMNESLEKSPGNKENVEPLTSNNIFSNSEASAPASPEIKLIADESADALLKVPTDNCGDEDSEGKTEESNKSLLGEKPEIVTTISKVSINESLNLDKTQQKEDLNSSHSEIQQKSILEESAKEDNNLTNFSPESPPAEPTPMETSTEAPEELSNKDNLDLPSSPIKSQDENTKTNKSTPASPAAQLESPKKVADDEDKNVENEDVDIENLFQDIPAEEWNANNEEVKSEAEGEKKQTIPEIVVSEDHQEDLKEIRDIDCNTDSNDTIIVVPCDNQSLSVSETQIESSEIQEPMDVDTDDDNETEIELDVAENNLNLSILGSGKKKQRLSKSFNNGKDQEEDESESLSTSLVDKNNSINLPENFCAPNVEEANESAVIEKSPSPTKSSANTKLGIIENKNLLRKSLDSAKLILLAEDGKTSSSSKKKLNASINPKLSVSPNKTEEIKANGSEKKLSASKSKLNDTREKISAPSPLNNSKKLNSSSRKEQELSDDQEETLSSDDKVNKSNEVNSESEEDDQDDYDDDDDEDENEVDNENKNNRSRITAPSLLLNDESSSNSEISSSENENSDMDSDIAKEYNFNGDSVSEYSDDNVPGDECRESETELSDEDDDGEDLADFIADDDEDGEDEEDATSMSSWSDDDTIEVGEEIGAEVEEDDNEEDQEDEDDDEEIVSLEDNVEEELESENDEEENYKDGLHKVQKLLKFDFNSTCKENGNDDENDEDDDDSAESPAKKVHNLSVKSSAKSPRNSMSKLSTPKTKSCHSTPVTTKIDSRVCKSADSKTEKRKKHKKTMENGSDNETKPLESLKKSKSSNSNSSSLHHNRSMESLNVTDHDAIVLMKEKLNETLPTLKLEPNEPKSSSKKARTKNNENNKENSVELSEELDVSESKKNKTPEKSSEKRKIQKKSLLESDDAEVEVEHKTKKSKTSKSEAAPASDLEMEGPESPEIPRKKAGKKKNKEKKENLLKTQANYKNASSAPSVNSCLKRLPEEIIDKLSDGQPQKKRKLSAAASEKILPSRKMFDAKHPKPANMIIETEKDFIPLSSNGGTTTFSVVNINKTSKQQTKKSAAALSFRQRMLGRNPRQPISAYLMYQQKLKASARDKY